MNNKTKFEDAEIMEVKDKKYLIEKSLKIWWQFMGKYDIISWKTLFKYNYVLKETVYVNKE